MLKIATWNVNSIRARCQHLVDWLNKTQPDIVMLQELKCEENQFSCLELNNLGYNIALSGQKSFNGVAIFSKSPIDDVKTDFAGNPDPAQARYIEITTQTAIGYGRFASIYFPNGGEVNSDKFNYKLRFYDAFTKHAESLRYNDELIFLGGDYNIAPEDIDVYDAKHLAKSTCFTLKERQKLRPIINAGWLDAYRLMQPEQSEFTWWDYRGNGFAHNKGMRIDHILLNPKAADYLSDCMIDQDERKLAKASDHAPFICEFS